MHCWALGSRLFLSDGIIISINPDGTTLLRSKDKFAELLNRHEVPISRLSKPGVYND